MFYYYNEISYNHKGWLTVSNVDVVHFFKKLIKQYFNS